MRFLGKPLVVFLAASVLFTACDDDDSGSDAILVDLYKIFDGRRGELIPDGRHPSAAGSRLIAESFASKL